MVSPELQLVDDAGASAGEIGVRNAFFNPRILAQSPDKLDLLLKGAATQVSQEVDLLMVDDLRSFLFGPPGAGGLDLAAINIQRGRDVGLPDYRNLAMNRNIPVSSFSGITADPSTAAGLATIYNNDINNVDAWVGMLAEDHVVGASVGKLLRAEIASQFQRLRDGDRLFYRSAAAGLYAGGVLNADIAAIIDLDNLKLSDILKANTSLESLQSNVFFVTPPGDFDNNGIFDGNDLLAWQRGPAAGPAGAISLADWKARFATNATLSATTPVPEPSMLALAIGACAAGLATRRRCLTSGSVSAKMS
jgi:peroxidase